MTKAFFIVLIFFQWGCVTSQKFGSGKYKTHPLSIFQGATTSTETIITVVSSIDVHPLKYFYSKEEGELIPLESVFKKKSPDQRNVVEHLKINELSLKDSYKITVKSENEIIDERSFKALDVKKEKIRIGVTSCTDDAIGVADKMWESYLNKFLDVNFLIGDNIYADKLNGKRGLIADKNQLWQRYLETFSSLYFYHSSTLTPTYIIWDDHDYGLNDGGIEYKNKADSLEVFDTFFPRSEQGKIYKKTMGAGSVLKAFGQKFIFIDNRYYRDAHNLKGSHWGKEQKKLILKEVKLSKAPVFLIQGDQFFGGYHPFESFEKNHPDDFLKTLSGLKRSRTKVLFISGDRHLTEIMKIEKKILGYETYEITSSGMHAKVFPGSFEKHPSPRQIVGKSGVYNYTVLEINKRHRKSLYKVTSYGEKDWVHYSKELNL